MSDSNGTPPLPLEHAVIEPREPVEGRSPSVVILHGRGADETDLLPVVQQLPDALFVVSLRAPERLHSGFTWYDLVLPGGDVHRSQPDSEDLDRSLDLVDESIERAIETYDLDPDRVGILGFSQGAVLGISRLLDRPDAVAWLAALHGYLPEAYADSAPEGVQRTPVFIGAGVNDRVIPPGRAENAAIRLSELGCAVTARTYDVGHGIGPEEMADLVSWVDGTVDP